MKQFMGSKASFWLSVEFLSLVGILGLVILVGSMAIWCLLVAALLAAFVSLPKWLGPLSAKLRGRKATIVKQADLSWFMPEDREWFQRVAAEPCRKYLAVHVDPVIAGEAKWLEAHRAPRSQVTGLRAMTVAAPLPGVSYRIDPDGVARAVLTATGDRVDINTFTGTWTRVMDMSGNTVSLIKDDAG